MIKLQLSQQHLSQQHHRPMLHKPALGFTLLEITIVLLILGLLSSFLTPLAIRFEQESRNNTRAQLDNIQQVLYGFVLKNRRLPCPDCADETGDCMGVADVADGQEDIKTDNTCATEKGNLPWATLGVRGVDAWDHEFSYVVSESFADQNDGTETSSCIPTAGVSFSLCSNGSITVRDSAIGADGAADTTAGNLIAENIPAIVVSHGENGITEATYSVDEMANADNNLVFIERDYSQSEDDGFDDILVWISPHVLRAMAVNAGILP